MRKTKVKEIRKYAVLSLAVFLMSVGSVFAATDWAGVGSEAGTSGVVNIEQNITTDGNALQLGAPPVPGGVTINGNGNTITAGNPASSGGSSFIINNTPTANTTINNTNFANGKVTGGANGGAIQNSATLTVRGDSNNKSTFANNVAENGNGGAVANTGDGVAKFENVSFSDNSATGAGKGMGGAIFNQSSASGNSLTIIDSSFENNTSQGFGGAVANLKGTVDIESSKFINNTSTSGTQGNTVGQGGAILNSATTYITGTADNKSYFSGNHAGDFGGAISNALGATGGSGVVAQDANITLVIDNTIFDGNYVDSPTGGGGAIYNTGGTIVTQPDGLTKVTYENTVNIKEGTIFRNNYVYNSTPGGSQTSTSGGAIFNAPANDPVANINGILIIQGTEDNKVLFEENSAYRGGAIENRGSATIDNAVFQNNGTLTLGDGQTKVNAESGGAIHNRSDSNAGATAAELVVSNSTFVNNTAASQGGAIHNESGKVTVIDSDFAGNEANGHQGGGAIYGSNTSETILRAQNKDMYVGTQDSVSNGTDSIAFASKATGQLQASQGKTLHIYSNVVGTRTDSDATKLEINKDYTTADGTFSSLGTVRIAGDAKIQNADISLHNGILSFDHDASLGSTANNGNGNKLSLYGGTLDLLNNEFGSNQLAVQELNLLGNTNIMLDVDLGGKYTGGTPSMDNLLDKNVHVGTVKDDAFLTVSGMKSLSEANTDTVKILFTDAEKLIGHVNLGKGANIVEAPINKYEVTHITQPVGGPAPADGTDPGEYFQFTKVGNSDSIIAGPVAAQAAFLIMDNLYRQSFANMDMVTLMSPEQRMAWKMRNKYANAGYHTGVYAPNVIPEERDGWYMRPFTNFENVPLKNGPRVSNVSYGSLFGGESDLIDLGHGWDGNFSFFGAYHGSHQAYNGVSIYQNGGTIGGVATAYKGNFFTGITANIGASAARATHMFGSDDFPILMTGAAWKSGYNWGLFNNKLVIQPSYMMSYTFVNVFDYTNSAGVKVTQDPLNAIEIIPGLRIIGNLKNGWQPYLGVNMTWNIMDKTKFYANEVALTQLSVKPYIEYGAGIQKRYGDRFTGFGQAMLRNGGRNGIAFTLGFRWALGN